MRHKNTKHSSSISGSGGVSVSSKEIIQKKLHPDVLLRIVDECAEICFNELCLELRCVEIFFFENKICVYI